MASWNPDELMFLPDLSSRKRDKSLHFLSPHPGTTDGLKSAVVSVSAALADTVSEVQRLNLMNEEAARTSGRFSVQIASLQDDLLEVAGQCRLQTAEIKKLTGRLQASMKAEAELQERHSEKGDEISMLQQRFEQLSERADTDVEALSQAQQHAHQQQTVIAGLVAKIQRAQENSALMESQLDAARAQAATACEDFDVARQEARSCQQQVAAQAAKAEDSERQIVASAAEIEHLDQALFRSEQSKTFLRAEANTAAEACNIAINEQLAAEQRHEGQMLHSQATITQLQDAGALSLQHIEELSVERDATVVDRAAAEQLMRKQNTELQQSRLKLLKEQRVASAAEASLLALQQELSGTQHQLRQDLAAALAAQQAERRALASLQHLLAEKERQCNEHGARTSELRFELATLEEDFMAQRARHGSQDALMEKMKQDVSAAEGVAQQAQQMQEVLAMEAHRAQSTARQVLSQLAEDRDASGFKASRLCGIIQELRAEKRDLVVKVDNLSQSQRREKIKAALLVTRAIPKDIPHAEALQGGLVRRKAAFITANAESMSKQLASWRNLREESQRLRHEATKAALHNLPQINMRVQQKKLLRFCPEGWDPASGYTLDNIGFKHYHRDGSTQVFTVHANDY